MGHVHDDHSLAVDEDGCWGRGDASSEPASLPDCFSGFFCSEGRDAPSSTSMSCVRGDWVTQQVQMNEIRSRKEIFRRLVDCFPSMLGVGDGVAFSVLLVALPLLCAPSFPLFRRVRPLTGIVSVDATHDPFSLLTQDPFSFSFVLSSPLDWWVMDVSVWPATGLETIGVSEDGWCSSAELIVPL